MKFLSMVAGVVAALGLVAAPVMAAQVDLLSDAQLAGIWAGNIDGNAVALDESNAATTGGTISNTETEIEDFAIAGVNAANNGGRINNSSDSSTDVDVDTTDVDINVLSNVQNFANGVNMSNSLLSLVTQQSNVLSNGSGSPHKVIQVNVNF